jgi:hypothetical protein
MNMSPRVGRDLIALLLGLPVDDSCERMTLPILRSYLPGSGARRTR